MTAFMLTSYGVFPEEVEVFRTVSGDDTRPICVYFPIVNVSVHLSEKSAKQLLDLLQEKIQ